MANVYTVILVENGSVPAGDNVYYTAPSGYLTVVRDICAINLSGFTAPAKTLDVYVAPAGAYIVSWRYPILVYDRSYHWEGRQAMTAGETLHINAGEALWSVRITGYHLTLP